MTTVQLALEKVPGVFSVHMDATTNRAVVQIDKEQTNADQLIKAVDDIENVREYSATVISTWP